MKRFIVCTLLVVALGVSSHIQAQFISPKIAWGLSAGGSHGTNATADEWTIQYRAFLQKELIPSTLLGQFGLGYVGLKAPNVYSSYSGTADLRLLYSPFSLPNLDPFLYGGFGVSKQLKTGTSFLPMIPLGVGVHSKISQGILLQIAGGYNLYLSDDLDRRVRGDNNTNVLTNSKSDGFYGFMIGLAFSLGGNDDESDELKKQEAADAEARRVKQQADDEARRVKQQADAEARRVKQQADVEARRSAALNVNNTDTVIVLVKGKTVVLRGINFEFNKSTLTKDSERILVRAYNAMVANTEVQVVITGHTDEVGNQESNQVLSLERAQAVRNWLVEKGIASNRMRTVGRGQNEPVASNTTDEGRAENRRIEFYVEQ